MSSALVLGHRNELTLTRLTAAALAVRVFEHEQGRLPEALEELVPSLLDRVPVDPLSAKNDPLKYVLGFDGRWRVYSVGLDGRDQGGICAPLFGWPLPTDRDELEELLIWLTASSLRSSVSSVSDWVLWSAPPPAEQKESVAPAADADASESRPANAD